MRPPNDSRQMKSTSNKLKGIPVVHQRVESGAKYRTDAGFAAIKNGVKQRRDAEPLVRGQKPKWLRAKMPTGSFLFSMPWR